MTRLPSVDWPLVYGIDQICLWGTLVLALLFPADFLVDLALVFLATGLVVRVVCLFRVHPFPLPELGSEALSVPIKHLTLFVGVVVAMLLPSETGVRLTLAGVCLLIVCTELFELSRYFNATSC